MKRIRRIASLLVAMVMVLAMSVTVFAAGTNTITVDVNFKGQEYSLYKLFNATTTSDRQNEVDVDSNQEVQVDGIAYTLIDENKTANSGHSLDAVYTITTADGTEKSVKAGDWFEYENESNKNLKLKSGVSESFVTSEDFRLFAEAYGVKQGNTLTANSDNDAAIKWENLDEGYYFISTTTGTLVTVTSIAPNAIVKDKNSIPTVEKTVQEDSLLGTSDSDGDGITGYQKQNDQEIGGTVHFKTIIKAKKGGSGYVLMDKMDSALTFSSDDLTKIKVYKGSVDDKNLLKSVKDYNAVIGGDYYKGANGNIEEGKATFTVSFTQTFLDTITADTDLIVLYTATINDTAAVNTAIPNFTTLQYGNNTRTEESETRTFVWGIDVLKYDAEDTENVKTKVLSDAEFVIYRTETENDTVSVYYATFNNNKFAGWVKDTAITNQEGLENLVKVDSEYFTTKGVTVLATGTDGKIVVTGFDEGTYSLLEVKAPNGYNKLSNATEVVIDSESNTDTAKALATSISAGTNNGSQKIEVSNSKGSLLPSTGGIGTTIFYTIGGILVVGAGILLVAKKRMSAR